MTHLSLYRGSTAVLVLAVCIHSAIVSAATDCSNATGCSASEYSSYGQDVNVVAGEYYYKAPDSSDSTDSIFYVGGSGSSMRFNSGTTINADASFRNNDDRNRYNFYAILAENGNVTIPQGVTINFTGQPLGYYGFGTNPSVIYATYDASIDSQATINLKSPNAGAYEADSGAVINVHDSTITLGADSQNSVVASVDADDDGTKINFNNVTINGSGKYNGGLSVSGAGGTINFNNSTLDFTGENSIGIDLAVGTVNLENSTINSQIGIALSSETDDDGGDASPNILNLKNSSITAQKGLLRINDKELYDYYKDLDVENYDEDEIDPEIVKKQAFTLNADNSKLVGYVTASELDIPSPTATFNLTNGSDWTLNGNSTLDTLNVSDSSVHFDSSNGFNTLTVNGDLTGSNATYYMNTSLADETSDKIVVEGKVVGDNKISISDSRKSPATANGKVTLVTSNGGDGSFSMVQKYVDAGKYRYYFAKSGNNWLLTNNGDAADENSADNSAAAGGAAAGGVAGGAGAGTGFNRGNKYFHPKISDYANSIISMRQAASGMLDSFQQPLNSKVFSLRNQSIGNNVWADLSYLHNNFDSTKTGYNLSTSGYKQNTVNLQLGYDNTISLGNGNRLYVGGLLGTGRSNVDFDKDYKNGHIDAYGFGVYTGWQNDANWFANGIYRFTHLKSSAHKMDDARWHANSITTNFGKKFELVNQWALTPQTGVTFGRLSGDGNVKASNFYSTKLGAAVEKGFVAKNTAITPFLGVYWINGRNNLDNATIDDSKLSIKTPGNTALIEAGMNVQITKNQAVNLKASYQGGNRSNNVGANLLYRYEW